MKEPKDQFEQHLTSFRLSPAPPELRRALLDASAVHDPAPNPKPNPKPNPNPLTARRPRGMLLYSMALAAAWIVIALFHSATPSAPRRESRPTVALTHPAPYFILLSKTDIDRLFNENF